MREGWQTGMPPAITLEVSARLRLACQSVVRRETLMQGNGFGAVLKEGLGEDHANQTKLLCINGKYKIGMGLRQVGKFLDAPAQPHAKPVTTTKSNQAL